MDTRQRRTNVEHFARSGPAAVALQKVLRDRDDAGLADPSDEECAQICADADFKATYGHDAKRDRHGNPIQQGIGSPGHESINHFKGILKTEGRESYERAVRAFWKTNPARARAIGLPELPRVGA